MKRVEGKVALVTGGVGGLGSAAARLLAREGAKVVVTDRKEREAEGLALAASLGEGAGLFLPLDVTKEADWELAMARTLEHLPANDPGRAEIVATFRQMAARLKAIQKHDGYWSPSLLGDAATSLPETSGTGFFTYGFAWGIKAGLLDRAQYEPVVRKGWAAMVRSLHPNGKLGYVQPISDRPENVTFEDTQYYGVGAFLLAATGVADLGLKD